MLFLTLPLLLHYPCIRLLAQTGGPYLAGEHISLDDMALAPKLYHVKVRRVRPLCVQSFSVLEAGVTFTFFVIVTPPCGCYF